METSWRVSGDRGGHGELSAIVLGCAAPGDVASGQFGAGKSPKAGQAGSVGLASDYLGHGVGLGRVPLGSSHS